MAILIELHRIENDESMAVYDYGFQNSPKGQIAIDKQTGECIDLKPAPSTRGDFLFSRARSVLVQHHEAREYPEETMYCA